MRWIAALLMPATLSGCLLEGASGPEKTPKESSGVGYTQVSADQLARCVAIAIGSAVTADGGGYSIAGDGVTYRAEATVKLPTYPTRLVVHGYNGSKAQDEKIGLCLSGTLPA